MHIFEREVNGHRYRIAAQSVWDAERGRSVARQVVLGPAEPPRVAHEAAHLRAIGHETAQQRGAHQARCAGKQQHRS